MYVGSQDSTKFEGAAVFPSGKSAFQMGGILLDSVQELCELLCKMENGYDCDGRMEDFVFVYEYY